VQELLSLTVIGLCTAAIFALAASGLVLTYTTTGIFNFAHGAIGMLGAFTYWQLHEDWGWPSPLALAVVLLVLAPALGALIERGIMRGLVDAPETVRIVVSISLLVALLGLGLWLWSPQEPHVTQLLFPGRRLRIFDVNVSWHQATALLLAGATALGLRLLLHNTRAGLDMRASVDSRPLAQLHGARPDRSATLAWAIGCALAALAGILIAPISTLSHANLTLLIVNAYAAAMIGRLRSLPMTFVGAVVLGLADSYSIGYIPSTSLYFSTFRLVLPVVILFIVLLLMPHAPFRTRSVVASREDIPRPSWRGALLTAGAVVASVLVLSTMLGDADALRAAKIFGIALVALSLVPLVGFGGQISLCQMSFAGIGAIVMAHHGQGGDPIALLWAAIACAVVGAVIALPALRLSGIHLALATAAFAVFLDRWVFTLPSFDVGPWTIKLFEIGTLPVPPVDLPGVGDGRQAQLVVLAVAFALLYLLVVAIRRSGFGQRLLAMKDSPAACETLGMDVTKVKLAVFSLSAAMAGVGGALYAGTLGSVSAETFSLFESLPLLLLAVVGGIGTATGALFAGAVLGGFPIAVGIWAWLADLNRILPGTMGVALGRNPNGAVRDIGDRYAVLRDAPLALGGLLASIVVLAVLGSSDLIDGWTFAALLGVSFVIWPLIAERIVDAGADREDDLEWAGVDRPLTNAQLAAVDAGLSLEDVRT
jgi:branched-chain amino acid transport system permease protein